VGVCQTDSDGVDLYILLDFEGYPVTKYNHPTKSVYPHGSIFEASREHPEGMLFTKEQVLENGWEID